MEKQKKQKILGILVMVALVIIMLPFFQANKELSTEAALIAAPPFPDLPAVMTSIPISTPASAILTSAEINQPAVNLASVWIVQIGSFKNKMNALKTVNQLRANGYHAFIQEMTTAFQESTRVYVGPESKQTTARALANKLQAEMHVKAIVISYKPFAL